MATYLSPAGSAQQPPRSPSHQPTNAYTTGLPAPPRILIPPPTLQVEMSFYESYQPSTEQMTISPSSSIIPTSLQDWKYESRREAQQLLPHLWLGPNSAAKDAHFIQKQGITLLLAVRSTMTARAKLLTSQLPGVNYESIDVSGNQELIAQFQRATQIIDEHYLSISPFRGNLAIPIDSRELLNFQKRYYESHFSLAPGGKTLLFCESGNERSAAVAAAYIMQHLRVTPVQSIQIVQSRRFCVCFDDSVKWLLTSYEPIWMARRQTRQSTSSEAARAGTLGHDKGMKKRRYEDEEEPADDHNKDFAPFADNGDWGRDTEMM